jgi:predicted nucleic acid-binding protein
MPALDVFIDTNILHYAISTDPAEASKATIAQALLSTRDWGWSAQIAAEFIHAGTSRRRSNPLTLAEAERWIHLWLAFPLGPIDANTVQDAIRLAGRYNVSYFHAQVIAAARALKCQILYTEDLNHGQTYDGIVSTNPFLTATP